MKSDRSWIFFLVFLTVLVTLPPILKDLAALDSLKDSINSVTRLPFYKFITKWATNFLFIGLVASISMVVFKNWIWSLLSIFIAFILSSNLMHIPTYLYIIGIFTPTVIHVFLFTALFMLYGALKENSLPGKISVFLLFACIFVIAAVKITPESYILSESTKANFTSSTFSIVIKGIADFFHWTNKNERFGLLSPIAIKIQIFLAFAYTYHYLNWFSKTSIIKWHQINKRQFIIISILWVGSVSLYLYNYRLGFISLLFLSMLHVFLEFPLNYVSVQGIVQELFSKKKKA